MIAKGERVREQSMVARLTQLTVQQYNRNSVFIQTLDGKPRRHLSTMLPSLAVRTDSTTAQPTLRSYRDKLPPTNVPFFPRHSAQLAQEEHSENSTNLPSNSGAIILYLIPLELNFLMGLTRIRILENKNNLGSSLIRSD